MITTNTDRLKQIRYAAWLERKDMSSPQELYVQPGLPERQFLTLTATPMDAIRDTGFKFGQPWSKENPDMVCVEMRADPLEFCSVNRTPSRWKVTCLFEDWRVAAVRSCYFQEVV